MPKVFTAELVEDLQIETAPDFVENSTTDTMLIDHSLRRRMTIVAVLGFMAGWFVVPAWIDRLFYRVIHGAKSPAD